MHDYFQKAAELVMSQSYYSIPPRGNIMMTRCWCRNKVPVASSWSKTVYNHIHHLLKFMVSSSQAVWRWVIIRKNEILNLSVLRWCIHLQPYLDEIVSSCFFRNKQLLFKINTLTSRRLTPESPLQTLHSSCKREKTPSSVINNNGNWENEAAIKDVTILTL